MRSPRPARHLPVNQFQIALQVTLGFSFSEHGFANGIEARPRREGLQLLQHTADCTFRVLDQEVARHSLDGYSHHRRQDRMAAKPKEPAPDAAERMAFEVGEKMGGDVGRGFELGQRIDETKQCRAQFLIPEGARQHPTLETASVKQ